MNFFADNRDATWMHHPDRNCNPQTTNPTDVRDHAEIWFPTTGHNAGRPCRNCPVINECLTYALAHPELEGIWGGTGDRDRYRLRIHTQATA